MATDPIPTEPAVPFLRMNRFHVLRFSLENSQAKEAYIMGFPRMLKSDFDDGRFKENACIIDINCWKFPICDVVNIGPSRDLAGLLRNPFVKRVKVRYVYDRPIKLGFEEARDEIVELICGRRWFSKNQDRESQKSFRARMAKCENMHDLIMGRRDPDPKGTYIGGISFYGEWVG
jgi:hypothetical protein